MADFLPNLRMKNIFDPSTMGQDFTTPQVDFGAGQPYDMSGPDAPYDVAGRMKELYHPDTSASDYFTNLSQNMPQYEKPSFLRTVAASLSAFGPGGHETGQQVMDFHNIRNMADWKNQLGPAYQAAQLERATNANDRTLAYQQVSNELRARADADRAAKNEREAAIKEHRAQIYEWKTMHPRAEFITQKGGNVWMVDPTTGAKQDTGIPSGSLTETDKMHLQQKQALERIDAQGENALDLEDARQTNRETNIGLRGEWTEHRDTMHPRGTRGSIPKNETASQRRTRLYNSAQELKNTDPNLGKWVTIEPGGRFRVAEPVADDSGGFFGFGSRSGPTQEEHDTINERIYGYRPSEQSKTESAPAPKGAPAPMRGDHQPADDAVTYWNEDGSQFFPNSEARGGSQAQPPGSGNADTNKNLPGAGAQGDKVKVISPDGKKGTIPRANLEKAIARGYKVVQ